MLVCQKSINLLIAPCLSSLLNSSLGEGSLSSVSAEDKESISISECSSPAHGKKGEKVKVDDQRATVSDGFCRLGVRKWGLLMLLYTISEVALPIWTVALTICRFLIAFVSNLFRVNCEC